jgi:thymidylate synthase (FAD)
MLQESTRFCNYNKNKFGNQITLIWPEWFVGLDLPYDNMIINNEKDIDKDLFTTAEYNWIKTNLNIEKNYFSLLNQGWTPQKARDILPNALKTEIVFKANLREWKHIFTLRTAKAAHPQMRELMIPLQNEFKKKLPLIFN